MFNKYPSLENLHSTTLRQEQLDQTVSVSEKIDGSNMSLIVRGEKHNFASRNQLVDPSWNNLGELVSQEFIDKVMSLYPSINLYGEVFSSKILKRIPYGDARVLFYDAIVDEKHLSESEFIELINSVDMGHMFHKRSLVCSLREAIELDVEGLFSALTPESEGDQQCEGIVIKGFDEVLTDNWKNTLTIKKKSVIFSEKDNSKKKPKVVTAIEDNPMFSYLNENRYLSYISKEGEITSKKQFGQYIKGIIDDAWEDFIKENEGQEDNRRTICGPLSKVIVGWLQERLKQNWLENNYGTE